MSVTEATVAPPYSAPPKQKKVRPPTGIRVRLAKDEADIESLISLSLEFHAASHMRDFEYDLEKRRGLFQRALDRPNAYGLLIAERSDRPVGFLLCAANSFIVGDGIVAMALSFYVERATRASLGGGQAALKLLRAFIKWAEVRSAKDIQIHVSSGIDIDRAHKFMRRVGFRPTGVNYSFRPPNGQSNG